MYDDVTFKEIIPIAYAEELRNKFIKNPELWYDAIAPREVADILKVKTNNDYSLMWHMHCDMCYVSINKKSKVCYVSDDEMIWLCKDCYDKLFKN